jgi:asparagine synthase (glutamine-hydrolysing)
VNGKGFDVKCKLRDVEVFRDANNIIVGKRYYDITSISSSFIDRLCKGKLDVYVDEKLLDGAFIHIVPNKDGIYIFRDPIGLIPCYIAHKLGKLYIALTKKDLILIGVDSIYRLDPWHIYRVDLSNITVFTPIGHPIIDIDPAIARFNFEEAVTTFLNLISERIKNIDLLKKHNKVYVSYSGGVDSSLTAKILQEAGYEVILISAGLEKSRDLYYASRASKKMGLDIILSEKKLSDAHRDVEKVIAIIEDFNPLNVSLSLAQYWVFGEVPRGNIISLGQGADEIYGGYSRYLEVYKMTGEKALKLEIIKKTLFSYFINFEREWKLSDHYKIINFYPLLSPKLVSFGLSLPTRYSIEASDDKIRKHVIRKAALKLGIEKELAYAPKRSLQYSSGSMEAVRKISKKTGLKPHEYLFKLYNNIVPH